MTLTGKRTNLQPYFALSFLNISQFLIFKNKKMKLNVKAFSLTTALICGIGLFLLTWWVILFEGATGAKTVIGLVYRGYNISPLGSLIGLLWGIVDGFIGGIIFAWLYNLFVGNSQKQ